MRLEFIFWASGGSVVRFESPKGYGTADWFNQEYAKVADDPWGLSWRPSQALRYQKTLELLEAIPQPCSRIMDIGCATGDFTHLLSRFMPHREVLLGVDFVESAVTRARQRFSNINFVEQSIFSLGETYEGQFDLVSCLEVLYYLEKEQQPLALKSIKKVLRDKGCAIFSSFISKPPYFTPDQLLNLVGGEFEVISSDVLYLKGVNSIEMMAHRFDKLALRASGGKWNGVGAFVLRRVPFSAIKNLESWSQLASRGSASHTIVLARAKD